MTSDTCIQCSIPAIQERDHHKRNIWLVMDKDGDWFVDYTGKYTTEKRTIMQPSNEGHK